MVSNEINQSTDLRREAESALMAKNGEVTTLNNQGFSLVIGTSIIDQEEEEMDFSPEDYPEYSDSESSEYDSWLG